MKNVILFASTFIFHLTLFAQKDTLQLKKIAKTKIDYKSYVLVNNSLFALNDSGKLVIWDLNKLDTIPFKHNSLNKFTSIITDRNNDVFIGTNNGDIFKINPKDLSYSL